MEHAYERGELVEFALWYADQGFAVFPLQPSGKKPLISKQEGGRGYLDATTDEAKIEKWWEEEPEANIGIVTGGVSGIFIVDVDGEQGEASLKNLIEKYGPLPDTVEVTTGKGRHLYFLMPAYDIRNSASAIGEGIDIRANGGYAVAPPSIHSSGRTYSGEVAREKIAAPPAWLMERILADKPGKRSRAHLSLVPSGTNDMEPIPEGRRNDSLFRYASQLRGKGYDEAKLLEVLSRKNAMCCQPPLEDEELKQIVASVAGYPAGDSRKARSMPVYGIGHHDRDWTDAGNSSRLVEHLNGQALYCGPLGGWLLFTGKRWERDTSNRILRAAKKTARKLLGEAEQIMDEGELEAFLKYAKASQSAKSLKAMVALAAPEVAVIPEQFDANPMVLNLANCVLDLDQMMIDDEHRPEHLFTMLAPVSYDEEAECPTWLAFLNRSMGGDQDMVDYLQRLVGYSISGSTVERCIFILVGNGANGKSTFLETITEMLGDYAATTPVETLMVKPSGGIPNDIARLKGARIVTASEGEIGQRLAESLVKRLSGQDKVIARFLHREFFEFTPQFKIFLGTNHLPQIRGNDEGVWDRIRLIPFSVRIPAAERDHKLKDKLRAELPGILAWAVQGYIEWNERGLDTPEAVRKATTGYRREMDLLGRFLEDCTTLQHEARLASGRLYDVYRQWCEENGERPETKKMIGLMMKERGFEQRKVQGYPNWLGLKLI